MKTIYEGFVAFDDVLLLPPAEPDLVPNRSRLDGDISTYVGPIKLEIPLIASPMDTVTEYQMAAAIGRAGGMGIIHRELTPAIQANHLSRLLTEKEGGDNGSEKIKVVPAVGITIGERERVKFLYNEFGNDIDMFCLDTANGHTITMREMIQFVKELTHGDIPIMAGNVAVGEGYRYLAESGADAVRVGIGGGCLKFDEPIITSSGIKKISEIQVGEFVATHTGTYKEVLDVIPSYKDEEIVSINGISTTKDHKYYVVQKRFVELVDEENIHDYAEWVEADLVDENYLLVSWD